MNETDDIKIKEKLGFVIIFQDPEEEEKDSNQSMNKGGSHKNRK